MLNYNSKLSFTINKAFFLTGLEGLTINSWSACLKIIIPCSTILFHVWLCIEPKWWNSKLCDTHHDNLIKNWEKFKALASRKLWIKRRKEKESSNRTRLYALKCYWSGYQELTLKRVQKISRIIIEESSDMEKYDNMVNNVYAYNINCMSTQRILCFVIICEVRDRENQGLQRNRCNLFHVRNHPSHCL